MANDLNIFDNHSNVLKTLDPDEVAKLDEADQAVLECTLLACREAEDAEAHLAETRKQIGVGIKAHVAAAKADREANPPLTHMDAARAVMAANNPNLPKPKPRKANLKTRAALVEAAKVLTTLQGETLVKAESAVRSTSKARGLAIAAWLRTQKIVTQLDQARDYAKRSGEQRAANVAAGLPAGGLKPEPKYNCELERVMSERGKQKQARTPANLKAFPGSGLPKIRAF